MARPTALFLILAIFSSTAGAGDAPEPTRIERFVAVDNVCAWPNLTTLSDGTLVATIFNQPSHGSQAGDVECWGSADGRRWNRLGTAAPHEPDANRMNVAAGLAHNGDLVVLASGWSNQQQPGQAKQKPFRDAILKSWVCRSIDGGRTWTIRTEFPDTPDEGSTPLVPFGDIVQATDGSLRATAYARHSADGEFRVWMLRSDDDGIRWSISSLICEDGNETSLLSLGDSRWLAAVRTSGMTLEMFRSEDDGATWRPTVRLGKKNEINGHLARLQDGRILLTYGNRNPEALGVLATVSADEGQTWAPPWRIAHSLSGDCGYPSSVQRPDGEIVTVWYSRSAPEKMNYHMGSAVWSLDPSRP